jgi:uncharacterized protein YbgA (DUF1722 family)
LSTYSKRRFDCQSLLSFYADSSDRGRLFSLIHWHSFFSSSADSSARSRLFSLIHWHSFFSSSADSSDRSRLFSLIHLHMYFSSSADSSDRSRLFSLILSLYIHLSIFSSMIVLTYVDCSNSLNYFSSVIYFVLSRLTVSCANLC